MRRIVKDLMAEKIVSPIKNLCPDNIKMETFLQYIFNLDSRIISFYTTKETTTIPGLYKVNGTIPTQGINRASRNAKKGKLLLVRCDYTNENHIEVENSGDVYLLSPPEWQSFKSYLKIRPNSEEI